MPDLPPNIMKNHLGHRNQIAADEMSDMQRPISVRTIQGAEHLD